VTRPPTRRALAGALAAVAAASSAALGGCGLDAPSPGRAAVVREPITAATIPQEPVGATAGDLLALARSFVYRVRNTACLATGTAFAAGPLLVTNRHVAAGASSVELASWAGSDFAATTSVLSARTDLAELRAPGDHGSSMLAPSAPGPGTPVWVAGYPDGDQLTVIGGKVIGVLPATDFGIQGTVLAVTDKVAPGNSGSPLMDSAGEVVGVVFAEETTTGDGLALSVSTLRSFLADPVASGPLQCSDL
jgi:S1-C subfamily serine protease